MRPARFFAAVAFCTTLVLAAASGAETKVSPELAKAMKDAADPVVLMKTTLGDITIELYPKDAPKSVANFLAYTKKKHYDGTIFHRVMPNFMIQGGGFTKDMNEKSTLPPIVNESKLSNDIGTIAMARTPEPNSATSQFFINVKNNAKGLDKGADPYGYAVFGKVIAGMDVVEKIKVVKTQQTPMSEAQPITPVVILTVTQLQ
jgi:peptidyl-prolyl cis-trans isomerase A (cyclophilin A)